MTFRDETSKVVDKYQATERSKLDCSSYSKLLERTAILGLTGSTLPDREPRPNEDDDTLPAFASLTNDEEWEQKAEYRPPGTYFVVANPSSFEASETPERSGEEPHRSRRRPPALTRQALRRRSEIETTAPRAGRLIAPAGDPYGPHLERQARGRTFNIPLDESTLVLGAVEGSLGTSPPRLTTSTPRTGPSLHDTSSSQSPSLTTFSRSLESLNILPEILPQREWIGSGPSLTVADRLKLHYKSFVRRHLSQIHREASRENSPGSSEDDEDVFEKEAADFPPVSLQCRKTCVYHDLVSS